MPSLTTGVVGQGSSNAAATINDNFDAVKSVVNGHLDNTNVKPSAGIVVTKLEAGADGQVVSMLSGAADWAAGAVKLDEKSPTGTSCDFTSIPSYYFSLLVVGYSRSTNATTEPLRMRFNGDTATNYGYQQLQVTNTTETSTQGTTLSFARCGLTPAVSADSGVFGVWVVEIPFYSNSANYKTFMSHGGYGTGDTATTQVLTRHAGIWLSTAAINQVTIICESGNYVSGSRVMLYGIG